MFVEPASAISLAGTTKLYQKGYFKSSASEGDSRLIVVCILTGHGLKNPDRAMKQSPHPVVLPPDEKKTMKAIN